jgi:hypothetical protein
MNICLSQQEKYSPNPKLGSRKIITNIILLDSLSQTGVTG